MEILDRRLLLTRCSQSFIVDLCINIHSSWHMYPCYLSDRRKSLRGLRETLIIMRTAIMREDVAHYCTSIAACSGEGSVSSPKFVLEACLYRIF